MTGGARCTDTRAWLTRVVVALALEGLVAGGALVAAPVLAAGLRDAVETRVRVSNPTPYAGEVVEITYEVDLVEGRHGSLRTAPTWSVEAVVAERWSRGRPAGRDGFAFTTRVFAPRPGRVRLADVEQRVALVPDDDGPGTHRFVTLRTPAPVLEVRALPTPAPPGFAGAVGQFTLASEFAPARVTIGEPVTWRLVLEGTGNWPAIGLPPRPEPPLARVLAPEIDRVFHSGRLLSGCLREAQVWVPLRAGDTVLDPVRFDYFDPVEGRYRVLRVEPPVVEVSGAPLVASSASRADDVGGAGRAPRSERTIAFAAGVPVILLALVWVGLAWHRARVLDPGRERRAAVRALRRSIRRVHAARGTPAQAGRLLDWQRHAGRALGIEGAAPTWLRVREWADAPALRGDWLALWRESEAALYAPAACLPETWCVRAETARRGLARARVAPRRRWLQREVWLPATLVALALLFGGGPSARAAAPQVSGAERAAPDDLGRWLAAFARAPRSALVRARLAALDPGPGALDPDVAGVVRGVGLGQLAQRLSPAEWQCVLVAASAWLCLALGAAIALRYRGRRIGRTPLGAAGALGGLGLAAALLGLGAWGPLARPDAALLTRAVSLRAVPTEAQPSDGRGARAVGAVVRVEGHFLGWLRVRASDGAEGWVRGESVLPVYRDAPG